MRRRSWIGTAALAVTAAGCTLFTALSDLDSEATRGGDAASQGALEAGTLDAGALEAGADVADQPDSTSADGGTDGALCQPGAHDLCDDFDTVPLGDPSRWTSATSGQRGATVALANDISFSSPNALSTTVAPDAGSNPIAYLSKDFTGAATALDCAFQLRAQALDAAGLVHVLTLSFTPPPATGFGTSTLELRIVESALDLRLVTRYTDGASSSIQRNLGPPLLGQWLSTRVRVSGLGSNARLEVWLGGNVAMDEPVTLPPIGTTTLDLGIVDAISGTTTWRTLFDDVICDLTRP